MIEFKKLTAHEEVTYKMGQHTQAEPRVSALYLSGAPNNGALEPLRERDWQIEVFEDLSQLELALEQMRQQERLRPDVVLLGGSVQGGEGSYWSELVSQLKELGVTRFVPFSSDKLINQTMANEQSRLGVQMVNILGEEPQHNVLFRDQRLDNLVEAIVSQRGSRKEALCP